MKRPNDQHEDEHDVPVTPEHVPERVFDLRLDLEAIDFSGSQELGDHVGQGKQRVEEEQEDGVVAVEEVIGLVRRVFKPQHLGHRQVPAEGGLRGLNRVERQHCCGGRPLVVIPLSLTLNLFVLWRERREGMRMGMGMGMMIGNWRGGRPLNF